MQHKPVRQALQTHFKLNAHRIESITRFILALLKVRTLQLTQIATTLNSNTA
jgi:hypothetical protein